MCATTLIPEPSIGTELLLESTLADAHDRWVAEVHRVLLPVTLPEATFWERWDAGRYLAERFPIRLQLEQQLSHHLFPLISEDDAQQLQLLGERLTSLHRECRRLDRELGTARVFAARLKELLEVVRLWCAEFELATAHIPEDAADEAVMQILGRMSQSCSPPWTVASRC